VFVLKDESRIIKISMSNLIVLNVMLTTQSTIFALPPQRAAIVLVKPKAIEWSGTHTVDQGTGKKYQIRRGITDIKRKPNKGQSDAVQMGVDLT
jgi:hypothetical protein